MATETSAVPRTARARARFEITAEILRTGREHLARDGAAALSLRAIARDLGMVSSAVYRYVPSRDALLTLLIIDAYNSLGEAVESAEAKVPRDQLSERFFAAGHATRGWAIDHPHEYALIYGSPVPGYAAPQDTIGPATRVSTVLLGILVDLCAAHPRRRYEPLPSAVAAALSPLRSEIPDVIPDALLMCGLTVRSNMFGAVSFELFGQNQNVISDNPRGRKAVFDEQLRSWAAELELLG
jgi:AcrR family transcriptional regulator